ncbi:hypothetical protein GCM10010885_17040 [Alicyclobacillus cellulosilyticus]|uniref:DUF58 domain-containing protein n=1 Tax=Alicyclobacillus cellulosilyticus TaxID=1003997 RepID=A0A917NKY0_9BACL|nr:DUF58 domain-containing protein [Alicyclobacillus cellulosilyticus]GGJ08513.1 hypothetical protein GCM10010885_17040 [Alicyclobacillus cellulosilyticus]
MKSLRASWQRYLSRADRMLPAPRLAVWWAVCGSVCFATVGWAIPAWWWFVAGGVLAAVCAADGWRLSRTTVVDARLDWEGLWQIGVPTEVRLTLQMMGPDAAAAARAARAGACFAVDDGLPHTFARPGAPQMEAAGGPGRVVLTWRRTVVPDRRGRFCLEPVDVRWPSRLGLWVRQRRFPPPAAEALVFPDLSTWRSQVLALQQAHLQEGRRVQAYTSGHTQFAHVAEYTPDDDPRRINWAASARRGRLMKNVYEPERGQQVVIAIDAGRYMDVRAESGKSRLDHAAECAAGLLETALRAGDHVGLVAFHSRLVTRIAPGRGDAQREAVLAALARLEAEAVQTHYGALFAALAGWFHRRGLVVILSDIASLAEDTELIGLLRDLRGRHQVLFVSLADAESERTARLLPRRKHDFARIAAAEWVLADRAAQLARLHRYGVAAVEAPAETLVPHVVRTYLLRRRRFAL